MINRQSAVGRIVGSWEILPPANLGELLASIDPDSLDDDDAIEFLKASARHRAWTDSLQSAALSRFAKLRPQLDGPGQEGISKFAAGEIAAAMAMPNLVLRTYGARNQPLDPQEWAQIKADYPRIREIARQTPTGLPFPPSTASALETDPQLYNGGVTCMLPGDFAGGTEPKSRIKHSFIGPDIGPRSVILDQVANGVAVRMGILYLMSGAG